MSSSLNLSGKQIKELLEHVAPDREKDPEQLETEVEIQLLPEGKCPETGELRPAGVYFWYSEYPEEGSILLSDD